MNTADIVAINNIAVPAAESDLEPWPVPDSNPPPRKAATSEQRPAEAVSLADIPAPELAALQCLAADPGALNGSALKAVHFSSRRGRAAFRAAIGNRGIGPILRAAKMAQAAECKELLGPLTSREITDAGQELAVCAAAMLDDFRASSDGKRWARVQTRRFDVARPVPKPTPRFLINGKVVCTPGNLTNIIAQAKAGKTAFLGALISAAICAELDAVERDNLGVTATAPSGLRLIHLDSEQSAFDHDAFVRRAMRRAGVDTVPPWLESYSLAGFSAHEIRATLHDLLADTGQGLFAIILDGVADLVTNPNDLPESNALVAELHGLAIEHDCPVVSVIHDNEGRDPNGDGRGHLGKQLMRKAESNLRLKKSGEIVTVFSEKQRNAPIPEKDGPRFQWSDSDGMHVSTQSAAAGKDDAKRERLRDEAEAVFQATGKQALKWADLRDGIVTSEGMGLSGARKHLEAMKTLGVVERDLVGLYRLSP